MLHALVQMDMQVLVGVVVVHIPRYVEFHAAHGVHYPPHRFPLNDHIEVGKHAGQVSHMIFQVFHTAAAGFLGVVHAVDLFNAPGYIDGRIPWNTHHVHLLVGYVVGHQNDGVRPAAGGIPAQQEEGEIVLLPSARRVRRPRSGGIAVGVIGVVIGHARLVIVGYVRFFDEEIPHQKCRRSRHKEESKNQPPSFFPFFRTPGSRIGHFVRKWVASPSGLSFTSHVSFPFR